MRFELEPGPDPAAARGSADRRDAPRSRRCRRALVVAAARARRRLDRPEGAASRRPTRRGLRGPCSASATSGPRGRAARRSRLAEGPGLPGQPAEQQRPDDHRPRRVRALARERRPPGRHRRASLQERRRRWRSSCSATMAQPASDVPEVQPAEVRSAARAHGRRRTQVPVAEGRRPDAALYRVSSSVKPQGRRARSRSSATSSSSRRGGRSSSSTSSRPPARAGQLPALENRIAKLAGGAAA